MRDTEKRIFVKLIFTVREEVEEGSTVNKSLIRAIFSVCYHKSEFMFLGFVVSRAQC